MNCNIKELIVGKENLIEKKRFIESKHYDVVIKNNFPTSGLNLT